MELSGGNETPIGFDQKQKRNLNPERKAKNMYVGRLGGRPFHATVDRVIDRANPVHVVHTG